ncbi:tape measure protein [Tistrella bauzanensis]|uniref:tape measure protein n=1 Tax=Tistrella TaxID=171436 RepID=UPI0031F6AC91
MATAPRSIAIRIGLEGRAQIQAELQQIEAAGTKTMTDLAASVLAPTKRLGDMERAAEAAADAARSIKPVPAAQGSVGKAASSPTGAAGAPATPAQPAVAAVSRDVAAASRDASTAGASAAAAVRSVGDAANESRADIERLKRSLEAVPATARAVAASAAAVSTVVPGRVPGASGTAVDAATAAQPAVAAVARDVAAASRDASTAGASAAAAVRSVGDAANESRADIERLKRSLEAVPATARAVAASAAAVSTLVPGRVSGTSGTTGAALADPATLMRGARAAGSAAGASSTDLATELSAAVVAGKQAVEAFSRIGASAKAARGELAGLARQIERVVPLLAMMSAPQVAAGPSVAVQPVRAAPARPVVSAVTSAPAVGSAASTAPVVRGLGDVDRAAVAARSAVAGLWAELRGGAGVLLTVEGLRRGLVAASTAAMDLERVKTILTQATGSAAGAAAEYQFVRDEAYRLGLSLGQASLQYGKFAAAAKGTKLEGLGAREVFTGVAEAAAVMGLNADQVGGTFTAFEQILSKGKVQAEELRGQLAERLPGAFGIAARAMGVSTAELNKMMEQGKLISDEFLPRMAAELSDTYAKALPAALKSARSELNRLSSALDEQKAAFGKGFLGSLTGGLDGMWQTASAEEALKRAEEIGEDIGAVAARMAQVAAWAVDHIDLLAAAAGTRLVIALGRAAVAFTVDAAAALRSAAAQRAAAAAVAAQAAAAAAATATTATATAAAAANTVATVEGAAADRVATLAAGQRSAAALGLAAALRGKAVASTSAAAAALSSARANVAAAQSAITAAGATATFGARLGAGAAAGGMFAGGLAALGGPIGLLVMGLTVAVPLIYSLSTAEDRATDAARAHADQIERMTDVNRQLIGASKDKQRELLKEQEIIAAKARAEMEIQQGQLDMMRAAQAAALAPRQAEIAQRRDQSSRLWMRGQVTDEMAAIDMPLPFKPEDIAGQEKRVGDLVQTYQTLADAIRSIRDLIDGPAGGGGVGDGGKDSEIKAGREAIEALIRDREAAAKRLRMIDLLGMDTDPAREADARRQLDARLRAEEVVAKASADRRAAMASALDAAQVPAGPLVDRVAGVIGQTGETEKAREGVELRRQQLSDQRQELAVAQARAEVAGLPVAQRERELKITQMVLDAQRQGVALTSDEIAQRRQIEADRAKATAKEWRGNQTADLEDELQLARERREVAALSVRDRERELKVIDLIAAARREGVDLTAVEIAGFRARIAEIDAIDLATQRVTSAQDFLADSGERAFDRIGSSITDAFTRGEGAAIDFGSVAQGVISEVLQSFIQLAAINPVKNALFGTNSPVLSDVGGLIGKLLGGGSSTATGPYVATPDRVTPPVLGEIWHDGGVAGGSAVSTAVAVEVFERGRRRLVDGELFRGAWAGTGLVPERAAGTGLRAGEVTARLTRGDEVLTRDDPRHRAQMAQRAAVATIVHGGDARMPAVTSGAVDRPANPRISAVTDHAARPTAGREVLALLLAGEEVVRQDDPRHRDNLTARPLLYHTGGVAGHPADERPWSLPPAPSRVATGGGAGGAGRGDVVVQVIDQRRTDGKSAAGDGVQVQRGKDGQGREVIKVVIAEVRRGIETGQFDRAMSSSYGLRRVGQ